jgi:hypothetical protein
MTSHSEGRGSAPRSSGIREPRETRPAAVQRTLLVIFVVNLAVVAVKVASGSSCRGIRPRPRPGVIAWSGYQMVRAIVPILVDERTTVSYADHGADDVVHRLTSELGALVTVRAEPSRGALKHARSVRFDDTCVVSRIP